MFEVLKNTKVLATGAVVMVGVTALSGCSSSESKTKPSSECIAVGFGSGKGGPGLIDVDVYPILKDHIVAGIVYGEVIAGNDGGEPIVNSATFVGAGEFPLSWDVRSNAVQTSTVDVSAEVAGFPQLEPCPETTLYFNPVTGTISPTYK